MKRPVIPNLVLAAICLLIVCVGMASATLMHRPIANGTQSTWFSQTGCNLTGPISPNPMLLHKEYPALNRTGTTSGPMMNKTHRGDNSTAGFLLGSHITPGGRMINNASVHNQRSVIAHPVKTGVDGTCVNNCLVNTNRTGIQPGFSREMQTHRKGMMMQRKNQSAAGSVS